MRECPLGGSCVRTVTPPEPTRYRVQVVCLESNCKLEDGLIEAPDPADAEAELRARMAAYPGKEVRGVLTRSDSVKPWLTINDPRQDAFGIPDC